jgi:arylsulfatase A-like enzyme
VTTEKLGHLPGARGTHNTRLVSHECRVVVYIPRFSQSWLEKSLSGRIYDSPRFFYALAALLLIAGALSQLRISIPTRPIGSVDEIAALKDREDLNVIFVLIDTLRADRLGSYGYERDTTPLIDELGRSGIRFAETHAQSSWTKTSMASLWTGLFPPRTGVLRYDDAVPPKATMPAEIFREAGYATAGIFRNGWVGANFGFNQGFETYVKPQKREVKEGFEKHVPGAATVPGTDSEVTLAALEFVRNNAHQKFLLYLHYMDAHQYAYEAEFAQLDYGSTISDSYDRAIRWTDANIDQLVAELEDLDLMKKTILVIASDHGEAFREHGIEGHAQDLHIEALRVPLIINLPFRIDGGLTVEPVTRNVDIWPTILDMVGLPPLPSTDGISLIPMIQAAAEGSSTEELESFAFLDLGWGQRNSDFQPLAALQHEGRKVMVELAEPEETLMAFDVDADPGERKNLKGGRPDWIEPLQAKMAEHSEAETAIGSLQIELDEMYRAQLEALGYVVK